MERPTATAPIRPALGRRKRAIRKLWSKYRLLLINDNTFKESFSIRLTPVNVVLMLIGLLGITAAITVSLIVFTPLKRYIPGYADTDVRVHSFHAATPRRFAQARSGRACRLHREPTPHLQRRTEPR
ncbi:MAG: hypothetical protein IPG74_11645 [Flavobacteriales bacterium]|nr:hypothetical protein [Flavobacteriales bacterium]